MSRRPPLLEPHRFTGHARTMTERLTARLSRLDALALFLNLAFAAGITYMAATSSFQPPDYKVYLETTDGAMADFYYAYWLLPVMRALDLLPLYLHFLLWGGAAVGGVFIAARIFGGRVPAALLTYQMLFATFYGQFTGIMVGALAVFWWALAQRRWHVAGFALFVAATKYHIAGPFALLLWLLADITWRDRLRVLVVPLVLGAISLVAYPLWPLDLLDNLRANPPKDEGSIALWQWIGPLALLLWLPLLLPMARGRRVVAAASAIALGLPYFQQTDLLMLYALPVGGLALLGNAGFLYALYMDRALRAMALVPLVIYIAAIGPPLLARLREVAGKQRAIMRSNRTE